MRHLWVIEEKLPGKNWSAMLDVVPVEVYKTKLAAKPMLLEWRTCMPDDYQYRVVKYFPRVGE